MSPTSGTRRSVEEGIMGFDGTDEDPQDEGEHQHKWSALWRGVGEPIYTMTEAGGFRVTRDSECYGAKCGCGLKVEFDEPVLKKDFIKKAGAEMDRALKREGLG